MYITEDDWKSKGLPNKLSEIIEVALKDLESLENDKNYCIDMQEYYSFDSDLKQCQVCLAGCILAREFELPLDYEFSICNVDTFVYNKLNMLDDVRQGSFRSAIYVSLGSVDSGRAIAERVNGLIKEEVGGLWDTYRESPRTFKENLKIAVKILKENGL